MKTWLADGIVEIVERIEISYKTIIFTVAFLVLIWFLYQIRVILLLLFVVTILTFALSPIVDYLERNNIPRGLGIVFIYLAIIGSIAGIFYAIIPPVVEQSVAFFNNFPNLLKETGLIDNFKPDLIIPGLTSLPGSVLNIILSAFSNLLAVFTVLVLTFYFLLEKKFLSSHLKVLFENKDKEKIVSAIIEKIEINIGGWVRGQLFLMIIVGTVSYIGFRILGLQFAIALAVLAGFLELIPNIGPTLAAIPAILVGFSMSPILGLGALFLSIAVQQFENHIIVPQVMKRTVGLHPIVTIICLLVGLEIGGIGGAILAIPSFLIIKTLVIEIYLLRKKTSK